MFGILYQTFNLGQTGGSVDGTNTGFLFLALILSMVIVMIIGRWIWNNVLVKYISIVKPIDSLIDFWLLVILLHMLFPSNISMVKV